MRYPDFIENSEFYSMDDSHNDLDQVVRLSENLKQLHQLTTINYESFDELILKYLKTGIDIFEMKIGIVSNIIEDDYIICNSISPDNSIKKGDVFQLRDTYCKEVFHSRNVLGFPHVGGLEEMKDHPVYQNMQLESYISAPIFVDACLFGTLNFTSTTIRKNGFSEHERDFISLMAGSIGHFLELAKREENFINANDRMKRLVGYVSHDLRNPLGNILALSDYLKVEQPETESYIRYIKSEASKSLEIVHTILDLAAMGTGKIEIVLEKTDFTKFIKKAVDNYTHLIDHKEINFNFNCEENLILIIDYRRIEQVINNLLSNAIKYTPEKGELQISVIQVNDKIKIEIINSTFEEYKSDHHDAIESIGFGLEIVREILKLHNSRLVIHQLEKTFAAEFELHIEKQEKR